ncbi:AMP-binding enzyme [Agromyces silvae]|uniref:AMP-binding enzyme n=1 Tax=Agromyces silvae TaxID=3388266 RepID=UPI00280A525F|nr:AMP-binding protein [Agromyces protaetiae]
MKPLHRVPAADVAAVTDALRTALDGGPAVWPTDVHHVRAAAAEAAAAEAGTADPGATRAAGPGVGAVPDAVDDHIALVVETSGSTDAPKRVLLSADALRASAEATAERLGGHGRWLLALPAHYIAGAQVLVRSILAGTAPVVLGEHAAGGAPGPSTAQARGPFGADAFVTSTARLMRTHDALPRYTSLVPAQLARLVEAADGDRDHPAAQALRAYAAVLIGGQALPEPLRVAAETVGARIVRTYGSSETAGGCVYDARVLPGVEARIGEDGIVELGGPTLADGYLGDPARTARAFRHDADGRRWYRTDDLGELAADGALRIRGRADDVIISGGVKVALGEIERAVRALPGLHDAVVVAADDPEWGQRAVVVAAEASVSLAELARATDAASLPPAGRPVRFVRLDRLPMLASGKPDRRAVAEAIRVG